jgi:hypothetical protein
MDFRCKVASSKYAAGPFLPGWHCVPSPQNVPRAPDVTQALLLAVPVLCVVPAMLGKSAELAS